VLASAAALLRNSLDDDGFPAAVQHQQEELQGEPSASDPTSGQQLLQEQVRCVWQRLPGWLAAEATTAHGSHDMLPFFTCH
jgi:hypothetical protein